MIRLTAKINFYDKGLNPRRHIYRGETFLAGEHKANELFKKGYVRYTEGDYEKKVVEHEIKEDPPEPAADPLPETETKEQEGSGDQPGFDYSSFTVAELKEYMGQQGIEIPKDARKAELIKAIHDYEKGD